MPQMNYSIDPATSPYARAVYDVSQESYGNSVAIDTLTDRTGNGFTVTGTSTARPLCITNALNGHRIARFDGTNDALIASTASDWVWLHDGHDITIIAVVRQAAGVNPNAGYDSICSTRGAATAVGMLLAMYDGAAPDNNELVFDMGKSGTLSTVTLFPAEVLRPPTWHILAVRYSCGTYNMWDASGGNDCVMYVDGLPCSGANAANLPHATGNPLTPLHIGDMNGTDFGQIDLAWLGLFDHCLPSKLFYAYLRYLAEKYGLGITYTVQDGSGYNAYPGIASCPDGSLIACYSNCWHHFQAPRNPLMCMKSSDQGRTWGIERVLARHATEGYNGGELFQVPNGPLLAFAFHSDSVNGTAECFRSFDGGITWSAGISLNTGATLYSACEGMGCLLSNRTLIWPVYVENTSDVFSTVKCVVSTDQGATWGSPVTIANGVTASKNYDECSIVKISGTYPTETLLAIFRNTTDSLIAQSTSTNSGATWGSITTVKTSMSARPFVFKAVSGTLYLIARTSAANNRGQLYYSTDNGATWSTNPYNLDAQDNFNTYSAAVEINSGKFLIITSSQIDISATELVPTMSWLRCMIHDETNIKLIT